MKITVALACPLSYRHHHLRVWRGPLAVLDFKLPSSRELLFNPCADPEMSWCWAYGIIQSFTPMSFITDAPVSEVLHDNQDSI